MLKKILQFFFKKKTKVVKKSESVFTESQKRQIDNQWNELKTDDYKICRIIEKNHTHTI